MALVFGSRLISSVSQWTWRPLWEPQNGTRELFRFPLAQVVQKDFFERFKLRALIFELESFNCEGRYRGRAAFEKPPLHQKRSRRISIALTPCSEIKLRRF